MRPQRIQRRRTRGWRMPEGAVYVGRPTRWGNPFTFYEQFGISRGVTLALYREAVLRGWSPTVVADLGDNLVWNIYSTNQRFIRHLGGERVHDLRGRDLACWCPEACGEPVALYGVPYGEQYDPCAKPKGHDGHHDPSVPPYCHADVLLELANPEREDLV